MGFLSLSSQPMDEAVSAQVHSLQKILRENYKLHACDPISLPCPLVEETTTGLPPPSFEATLVSDPMSPVDIYLGNVSDSMYPTSLISRNIVGIINMAHSQCLDFQRMERAMGGEVVFEDGASAPSQWEKMSFTETWYRSHLRNDRFMYLPISSEDHPRYRMRDHFEECLEFLGLVVAGYEGKDSPKKPAVLIHCIQGLNRSAVIAAAWLMRSRQQSVEDAVRVIVSKRRGKVLSNRGFLRELVLWDRARTIDSRIKPESVTFSIGDIIER